MSIQPEVLYIVENGDHFDFGWSPDGWGVYWWDENICTMDDFLAECRGFPRHYFASDEDFDNFRFGA